MTRRITYAAAIREALDLCLARDPSVYVMGLGATDPKGIFGTTLGLAERHPGRVFDMPTSENALTGVAIGSALAGMRPVLVYQRVDFALMAADAILNNAAKWIYGTGGRVRLPLVLRLVIGRGWGQGPQHAQSLQAIFAHVPGLKVVMPATPADAKGMLAAAVEEDSPVVFLEHRWLHDLEGPVPEGLHREPLGGPRIIRGGDDVTIAAVSWMTVEALRAAEALEREGISAEVIDLRTLKPFDEGPVVESVRRTGRLIVADTAWITAGFSAEVVARVVEAAFHDLRRPPRRLASPDCPSPAAPSLAARFYPRAPEIAAAARELLDRAPVPDDPGPEVPLNVPDRSFAGPF